MLGYEANLNKIKQFLNTQSIFSGWEVLRIKINNKKIIKYPVVYN